MFHPEQFTKKGEIKPALFDQVHNKGRSIQRDSIATEKELLQFVTNFLKSKPSRKWHGVVSASCDNIRKIRLSDYPGRAVCVFDTAEQQNPAHGEMCRAQIMDEADQAELRREIWKAFDAENIIPASTYRDGLILKRITNI